MKISENLLVINIFYIFSFHFGMYKLWFFVMWVLLSYMLSLWLIVFLFVLLKMREATVFALASLSEHLLEEEVYSFSVVSRFISVIDFTYLSGSFCCARFTVPLICTSSQQSSYGTSIFFFIYINLSIQVPRHSRSSLGELIERIITEDIGIGGCFHYCIKRLLLLFIFFRLYLFSFLGSSIFISFSFCRDT